MWNFAQSHNISLIMRLIFSESDLAFFCLSLDIMFRFFQTKLESTDESRFLEHLEHKLSGLLKFIVKVSFVQLRIQQIRERYEYLVLNSDYLPIMREGFHHLSPLLNIRNRGKRLSLMNIDNLISNFGIFNFRCFCSFSSYFVYLRISPTCANRSVRCTSCNR